MNKVEQFQAMATEAHQTKRQHILAQAPWLAK
jgi:hypothetical protein